MRTRWSRATFLAASVLLLSAASTQAQWTWLYPTPHGNDLHDVTFLDDITAIAVGDVGTIMVSHDAGATWTTSLLTDGVATTLLNVARIDATTAVAAGAGGRILKTTDSGASWYVVSSGTTATLGDVDFAGPIGLIAAGTVVLRSADRGETWVSVTTPYSVSVRGVDMATTSIGYATAEIAVMKTIDGGATWTFLDAPVAPEGLTRLSFVDALNGAVISSRSLLYITHDGGATWAGSEMSPPYTESSAAAVDVEYRLPNTILACVTITMCDIYSGSSCSSDGNLFRSTNDGLTWSIDNVTGLMNGVTVNDAGVALLVGTNGIVHRWSPPSPWQQVAGGIFGGADDPGRLAFRNADQGFVLGSSTDEPANPFDSPYYNWDLVMRTTNGGSSWANTYTEWGFHSDVAYAQGSTDAFAVVTDVSNSTRTSKLLKSPDNGATWTEMWSAGADLALTGLEFSSATHGVAVGGAGYAAVLDGATVTTISIPSGIQNLGFADASTVVAVGGGTSRIIRSTDAGTTWTPVASPLARTLNDVSFSSPSTGVIVGYNGSVLRTTDAGQTWSTIAVPTAQHLMAVSFSGAYGLAVGGYSGAVLETVDAGLTWTNLAVPATGLLTDVVVFGPHHALIAGSEMTVLEYRENTVPTLFSSFDATPHALAADLSWSVQDEASLSGFRVTRNRNLVATLGAGVRSYRDASVRPGTSYEYTLVAVDNDGNETQSMPVKVTIPKAALELLPNQPNPFNPETTIRFVVPEKMRVTLAVHDVAGRVVAMLVDEVREPGMQTINWNAHGLASGVYFAKLRAGKTEVSRKMVLLK